MIEFGMENLVKKKKKKDENENEIKKEEEELDEDCYKNMINLLFEEENNKMMEEEEEDEKKDNNKNRGLYEFEGKNWGDERRRKKDKEALENLLSDEAITTICSSELSYM